jgi:acyl dehydratase
VTARGEERVVDGRHERHGRYFEELEEGVLYKHWPGRTITEAEDHQFCQLTSSSSPVHVDAHYAAQELPWGRNVVVGLFVYSVTYGLSVPDMSGKAVVALGVSDIAHPAPLFHGDTLYSQSRVVAKRESSSRPGMGIVTIESEGLNQHGEVVCTFRRTFMVARRPPPGA